MSDTPTPPSGIRGIVAAGPDVPGRQSEPGADDPVPCLTPYAAPLVVLDREGAVVAASPRVLTAVQVDLPPGEYVVTPATGHDTYPIAQPVSVTVGPGQYTEVEINYDTGIR